MQNEIKELEPGILFYGKAAKTSAYGFGLLLGPSEKSTNHWQVRCVTYTGDAISCTTQDVTVKSLKEDWPKMYEWVA
tara:strand:+ start:1180 stop:1410 length:231 start_codon:yes stop_codon:yes gene_type:complete